MLSFSIYGCTYIVRDLLVNGIVCIIGLVEGQLVVAYCGRRAGRRGENPKVTCTVECMSCKGTNHTRRVRNSAGIRGKCHMPLGRRLAPSIEE